MNAIAQLKAVEVLEPVSGQLSIAHMHALNLVEHCYRASIQSEGSDARRHNVRSAILDLEDVAKRLGFDLVPAREVHHV